MTRTIQPTIEKTLRLNWSSNPTGCRKPRRVQLSRKKGFRLPDNTVVVSRPSKWGNPFKSADLGSKERAVYEFRLWVHRHISSPIGMCPYSIEDIRRELGGKNLACWCRDCCHASVLLEIANFEQAEIGGVA